MLLKRTVTATLLIAAATVCILLGSRALAGLMALGFAFAGHEFLQMCRQAGYRPHLWLGTALIVILLLDGLAPEYKLWYWGALGAIVLPVTLELVRPSNEGFLLSWALLALGVLYIGGLGAHAFHLAQLPDGLQWLAFTMMATWAADASAYGVGKRWGRRPFYPHISPKKTVEGAAGGIAAAAVSFFLLGWIYGFGPGVSAVCGLGVGIAATIGDLAESLVKRQVGMKDSGALLAGHGGVLDRLDSSLFTIAFTFWYVWSVRPLVA